MMYTAERGCSGSVARYQMSNARTQINVKRVTESAGAIPKAETARFKADNMCEPCMKTAAARNGPKCEG